MPVEDERRRMWMRRRKICIESRAFEKMSLEQDVIRRRQESESVKRKESEMI